MGRHAYLIMAHNNFDLLQKELMLLDDDRNDIYIHIDKKTKDVDEAYITEKVKKSHVYFIPRIDVKWGGYSVAQCTINLLKAATKNSYQYYHLMSGADLPLKTQDEIHDFFDKGGDFEYVSFDAPAPKEDQVMRVKRYYMFQDVYGRNHKKFPLILLFALDKISLKIQKICKVDRFRGQGVLLQKGPEWFSITDELARIVVRKEEWIKKHFSHTRCCDEVFLHTILNNSKRKNHIYQNGFYGQKTNACLRLIDWGRGKPYIWRGKDFEELIQSEYLFARKFDPNVDTEIIDKLVQHLIK